MSDSNSKLKKSLGILQKQAFSVSFKLDGYPYQALETIGTGAYGVVCSAVNTSTGTKVRMCTYVLFVDFVYEVFFFLVLVG